MAKRISEHELAARLQGRVITKVTAAQGNPCFGIKLELDDGTTLEAYGFGTEMLGILLDDIEVGGA